MKVHADERQVVERVRAALVSAALAAYEDASLRGLCAEGAWEVAIGAMQTLDLSGVVAEAPPEPPRDS